MAPASLSQPTTLEAEPAWQPSPMGRGTIDLLKSCVLTLILCVWTAVHPDVPARKYNTVGWNLLRRFLWMVIGFLAPEVVLWVALNQYIAARKLCPKLKELIDEKRSRGNKSLSRSQSRAGASTEALLFETAQFSTLKSYASTEPEDGWNNENDHGWGEKDSWLERKLSHALAPLYPREMTLALYIVMGGFGIEVEIPLAPDTSSDVGFESKARPHFLHSVELRLLSAKTVLRAIKCDVITLDQLNPNAIKDRSKADLLSKFILLLQACWMIVQCIARTANSIPLTLLEYNTLMHVVATLLMYVLWLKKPQDTYFPTLVRPGTTAARAYFLGNLIEEYTYAPYGEIFGRSPPIQQEEIADVDEETLIIHKGMNQEEVGRKLGDKNWESIVVNCLPERGNVMPPKDSTGYWLTEKDIYILYWMYYPEKYPQNIYAEYLGIELGAKCCWIIPNSVFYNHYDDDILAFDRTDLELKDRQVLMHEGTTEPLAKFSKETMFICALTALYGAVHLIPWNSHFPSGWEQYLWRIACAIVTGGATAIVALNFGFFKIGKKLDKIWDTRGKKTMWDYTSDVILYLMLGVYTIARIFIFVEAFASLRSLPKGAYSTVNWVEFFPHL